MNHEVGFLGKVGFTAHTFIEWKLTGNGIQAFFYILGGICNDLSTAKIYSNEVGSWPCLIKSINPTCLDMDRYEIWELHTEEEIKDIHFIAYLVALVDIMGVKKSKKLFDK